MALKVAKGPKSVKDDNQKNKIAQLESKIEDLRLEVHKKEQKSMDTENYNLKTYEKLKQVQDVNSTLLQRIERLEGANA